jgi:hypothetical protein
MPSARSRVELVVRRPRLLVRPSVIFWAEPTLATRYAYPSRSSLKQVLTPAQLVTADQIVADLGGGADAIAAAIGMVTAEKNTNPFANGNVQNVCGDPSLPATAELRGITPLIDPDVDVNGDVAALSASSAAAPLAADGLSVFDLLDQAGLGDLVVAQQPGGGAGAAAGAAAGGAAAGDAADNANQNNNNNNNANDNAADDAAADDNAAADDAAADDNAAADDAAADDADACDAEDAAADDNQAAAGNANDNANDNDNQAAAGNANDNANDNQAAAGNANDNANDNQNANNNQNNNDNQAAAGDAAAGNDAAAGDAAAGGAAAGGADFGQCTPTITFQGGENGRPADEFTFQIADELARGGQGEALNPNIITNALCNQLTNVCEANAAAVALCEDAAAQVEAAGTRNKSTADLFNSAVGFAGAVTNPDGGPEDVAAKKVRRSFRA